MSRLDKLRCALTESDAREVDRRAALWLVVFVLLVALLLLSAVIGGRASAEPGGASSTPFWAPQAPRQSILLPPAPVPPSADLVARARLVGRLSLGVERIGRMKGGGRWWECGEIYDDAGARGAAIAWASRIVALAADYSDHGSTGGRTINPWGVAGTAANESGFDRCALGKWPRRWAYERDYLPKPLRSISYTFAQIEYVLTRPDGAERWATVGFDAAPLHELWRCREGRCAPKFNPEGLPPLALAEVFSLGRGFEYDVRKLKKIAIQQRTDRPWLFWRGYRAEWYDEKVTRWARLMGARRGEI